MAVSTKFYKPWLVSLVLHLAVIVSFYRVVIVDGGVFERGSPPVSQNHPMAVEARQKALMDEALSPFMDKTTRDSIWAGDDAYIKQIYYQLSGHVSGLINLPRGPVAGPLQLKALFLSRYLNNQGSDSLLALSEFIRRLITPMAMKAMESPSFNPSGSGRREGPESHRKFIENLLNELESRLSKERGQGEFKPLGQRLLSSPAYRELLERVLEASLRQAVKARLKKFVRDAAVQCLKAMCQGQRGRSAYGGHSGGKGVEIGSSKGQGAGYNQIPPRSYSEYLARVLSDLLQSSGGHASLFDGDSLARDLAGEAVREVKKLMGSDSASQAFTEQIDFESLMATVLAGIKQKGEKGPSQEAKDYASILARSLGASTYLQMRDASLEALFKGGHSAVQNWANSYLDLIMNIGTPNLLVPDIGEYAKAARDMRNRELPMAESIKLEKGYVVSAPEESFFSPGMVTSWDHTSRQDTSSFKGTLRKSGFASLKWGGAPRALTLPVIDGVLNEWEECGKFKLSGTPQGGRGAAQTLELPAAQLLVQWDNDGFYFAYSLDDENDNETVTDIFWAADALELFIDPFNYKDEEHIQGRSYQFWVWPRSSIPSSSAGQSVFTSPASYIPRLLKRGIIRHASQRYGARYSCEVFMPHSLLGNWRPLPGRVIGFNFSINNGEGAFMRWVTNLGKNISISPNLWGDLLLMGSPARITLSPEVYILPGQVLNITVTDADMNLRADKVEQLYVNVSSTLTDDEIPLELSEVSPNSGVFTSELGTVFGTGPRLNYALSVRPGSKVEVYYLDQHGVGGSKNVPLTAAVGVGRGVMALNSGESGL